MRLRNEWRMLRRRLWCLRHGHRWFLTQYGVSCETCLRDEPLYDMERAMETLTTPQAVNPWDVYSRKT